MQRSILRSCLEITSLEWRRNHGTYIGRIETGFQGKPDGALGACHWRKPAVSAHCIGGFDAILFPDGGQQGWGGAVRGICAGGVDFRDGICDYAVRHPKDAPGIFPPGKCRLKDDVR